VAAVSRLNNSLPLFPKGRKTGKFTPKEILKILQWSIPKAWRTKFELDGYVPMEFTKKQFMTECKAAEQNKPDIFDRRNNLT
jgi:hypothetical protein